MKLDNLAHVIEMGAKHSRCRQRGVWCGGCLCANGGVCVAGTADGGRRLYAGGDFCGGEIVDYDRVRARIRQGDMLICADSGYRHAKIMGLRPDIVLGDFDSMKKRQLTVTMC